MVKHLVRLNICEPTRSYRSLLEEIYLALVHVKLLTFFYNKCFWKLFPGHWHIYSFMPESVCSFVCLNVGFRRWTTKANFAHLSSPEISAVHWPFLAFLWIPFVPQILKKQGTDNKQEGKIVHRLMEESFWPIRKIVRSNVTNVHGQSFLLQKTCTRLRIAETGYFWTHQNQVERKL